MASNSALEFNTDDQITIVILTYIIIYWCFWGQNAALIFLLSLLFVQYTNNLGIDNKLSILS